MKTAPDLALFFLKFWYKSVYFQNREDKTRGQNRKHFTILYKGKLTAMYESPQNLKNNKQSYCTITKKKSYKYVLSFK